jgi:large subunit ribosomal protein L19
MTENETNNSLLKEKNLNLIQKIESKYLKNLNNHQEESDKISVGNIIRIAYTVPEGDKERIQYYEGLVIGRQNRGLGQSFTIRRTVQGIGVEQVFLVNSPKIISITKKQSSKVRRAKLYFIRTLVGKALKLKQKL